MLHLPYDTVIFDSDVILAEAPEVPGLPRYGVCPGVRELLGMLRQNGVFTAVIASMPQTQAEQELRACGLYTCFDRVLGEAEETGRAALPEKAMPRPGCHALAVGSRPLDIKAAKAAGIDAVGITSGELEESGADALAESLPALTELLLPGVPLPRGCFISMEGPDGCGKTTQMKLLEESLLRYGFRVHRTREPGGSPLAEKIRDLVLDPVNTEMTDLCEAMLYAAARAQHVREVIIPAVEAGELVLSDRFVDSSIAYQGGGRRLGTALVERINAPAVGDMLPFATVYLDIGAKDALMRRLAASEPDRLENESTAFHERVTAAYHERIAAHPERFLVVNAAQPVEKVAADVLRAVLARLLPLEPWLR